jgi:hypothetical protein
MAFTITTKAQATSLVAAAGRHGGTPRKGSVFVLKSIRTPQFTFRFSADSLPLFAMMSNVTLSPDAR